MEVTVIFMLALFVLFTAGTDADSQKPVARHQDLGSRYERPAAPGEPQIEKVEEVQYLEPQTESADRTEFKVEPRESDELEEVVEQVKTPARITYRHISLERVSRIALHYNEYLKPEEVNQIYQATDEICRQKDIDPALILALIARESSFNPYALSSSGAKGLGQIMEFNFDVLGIGNPYNIQENIRGTVIYFQQKLYDFKDEPDQTKLALGAYKEGSGAVKRAGNSYSEHTAGYIADILEIRSQI